MPVFDFSPSQHYLFYLPMILSAMIVMAKFEEWDHWFSWSNTIVLFVFIPIAMETNNNDLICFLGGWFCVAMLKSIAGYFPAMKWLSPAMGLFTAFVGVTALFTQKEGALLWLSATLAVATLTLHNQKLISDSRLTQLTVFTLIILCFGAARSVFDVALLIAALIITIPIAIRSIAD